jgi:hypothetical protein
MSANTSFGRVNSGSTQGNYTNSQRIDPLSNINTNYSRTLAGIPRRQRGPGWVPASQTGPTILGEAAQAMIQQGQRPRTPLTGEERQHANEMGTELGHRLADRGRQQRQAKTLDGFKAQAESTATESPSRLGIQHPDGNISMSTADSLGIGPTGSWGEPTGTVLGRVLSLDPMGGLV